MEESGDHGHGGDGAADFAESSEAGAEAGGEMAGRPLVESAGVGERAEDGLCAVGAVEEASSGLVGLAGAVVRRRIGVMPEVSRRVWKLAWAGLGVRELCVCVAHASFGCAQELVLAHLA